MYKPKWIRFSWSLPVAVEDPLPLPGKLDIRPAVEDEFDAVWDAIERSYNTEMGWGILLKERLKSMKLWVRQAFDDDTDRALALVDGPRVVGASILDFNHDSPLHFLTGACVLEEYRCRGAGSCLLAASLQALAKQKLPSASVVTRSNVAAARFLYSKFQSTSKELENFPQYPIKK